VAIMALESPAFAQCIDVPSKQTVQTVDPLNLKSIYSFFPSWLSLLEFYN